MNENKEGKVTENKNQNSIESTPQVIIKSKGTGFAIFLLLILGGLCFLTYYFYNKNIMQLNSLKENCTPVSTSGEEKELNINSTIIQDLYNKVKTNIKEDLANNSLDDSMKLYLAYRQIPTNNIYKSNCNYFDDTKMYPYTCEETIEFSPVAFKEETLQIELKKLFGETTNIKNGNIQLSYDCIGGFEYIEGRGEYVSGKCATPSTTVYSVNKELKKATSKETIIKLYEEVKYHGIQGNKVPDNLKNGTYIYTFKLDTNYNYVYISKELAN